VTDRTPASQGITGISVQGYKCLHERLDLDIRPLTVLAGVNSSGKSSAMQPLLLLKQTIEATYDPGPLLLDGPHVSVTTIDQILSRAQMQAKHERSFSVGVKVGNQQLVARYGKDPDGDLRVLGLIGKLFPTQATPATFHVGMPPEEIFAAIPRLRELSSILENRFLPAVRRERCFLQLYLQPQTGQPEAGLSESTGRARKSSIWSTTSSGVAAERSDAEGALEGVFSALLTLSSSMEVEREIAQIIHLPALRGNPRRTYRTAAIEGRYPGPFDTYTAGIIAAWQNRNHTESLTQLRFDVEELGLTWKVEARQLDDTQVELLVGRLPRSVQGDEHDVVNIADVGFGVSQTLPVIVALLAAEPGQLVYLEQPEIHLHPRAQVRFARLLKRAVDRGARVVIETHSSLLIRGIQTLTAQGLLKPDDIALHWFTRDETTGHTKVSSAELDETGAYGQWPEDFDDVHLAAESDYLDAAARRAATQ
jgi:AAA domain, putative AbiEii toxin, Type IV TA system/Protein of unknown function (DUF3696)